MMLEELKIRVLLSSYREEDGKNEKELRVQHFQSIKGNWEWKSKIRSNTFILSFRYSLFPQQADN